MNVRRQFAVLLAIAAISVNTPTSAQRLQRREPTPREIAARSLSSVVVLMTEDKDGEPSALGSGFFVNDGLIATNYHVVQDASKIYVKVVGRQEIYEAFTVRTSAAQDLALLRAGGRRVQALPLGDSRRIAIGDTVYVAGNPEGLEGTFSVGIVSGLRGNLIQITAPISHGSSGGPVLDKSGKVIGVALGLLKSGQNLNFAVAVSALALEVGKVPPLRPEEDIYAGMLPVEIKRRADSKSGSENRSCSGLPAVGDWTGTENFYGSSADITLHLEVSGAKIIGTLRYISERYDLSGSCVNGLIVLSYDNSKYRTSDPWTARFIGRIEAVNLLTGKSELRSRSGNTTISEWRLRRKI